MKIKIQTCHLLKKTEIFKDQLPKDYWNIALWRNSTSDFQSWLKFLLVKCFFARAFCKKLTKSSSLNWKRKIWKININQLRTFDFSRVVVSMNWSYSFCEFQRILQWPWKKYEFGYCSIKKFKLWWCLLWKSKWWN